MDTFQKQAHILNRTSYKFYWNIWPKKPSWKVPLKKKKKHGKGSTNRQKDNLWIFCAVLKATSNNTWHNCSPPNVRVWHYCPVIKSLLRREREGERDREQEEDRKAFSLTTCDQQKHHHFNHKAPVTALSALLKHSVCVFKTSYLRNAFIRVSRLWTCDVQSFIFYFHKTAQ